MPTALILGCGECVWSDALAALRLFDPDAIFVIKDMVKVWPYRIDYFITLHPERTESYLRERKIQGWSNHFSMWAHKNVPASPRHNTTNDWAGSSGLFAVRVALQEDFECIVLAGVPMDSKQGHIARREVWPAAQMFKNGWNHRHKQIKPFVRSMSGWTKEQLGSPTAQWLQSHNAAPPNPEWVFLLTPMEETV